VTRHDESRGRAERSNTESIPIALGQEDDGRWRADIESMPGAIRPGCDARFRYINRAVKQASRVGEPFISVDTKKERATLVDSP